MTAARYGITMAMLGPLEMSISFLSTMNDTQTEVACLLQVASNQSAIYVATSASFLLALFAADFPVRAAKSVLECRSTNIAPGMQSLVRPGSSSLSWAGSSRHCASNSIQRTHARRIQAPVLAYTVSQANQSASGSSSPSQDKKQAGRDTSDTIRSLDSILGSTDDTEIQQERTNEFTSASSSSVPAFSGSSAAVGLSPSRPQERSSRDFQGASSSSRSAVLCHFTALHTLWENGCCSELGKALSWCHTEGLTPGPVSVGVAPQQMPSQI